MCSAVDIIAGCCDADQCIAVGSTKQFCIVLWFKVQYSYVQWCTMQISTVQRGLNSVRPICQVLAGQWNGDAGEKGSKEVGLYSTVGMEGNVQ